MFDFKKIRVLVTGGAGFIGSNLCSEIIDKGAFVRCFDNFSTGDINNITELKTNENFELFEGDIRNTNDCELACFGIDYVLHNAALGSVPRSIVNPKESNDVNITGFLNILIASKNNNVKKVIYASSSSVYGDSNTLPKIENEIGKTLSPYATTKLVNELYSNNFKKNYNLDSIGLRYFNVFGKKQNIHGPYAAVIPIFIKKLMNYESPVINGDGSFSRDFTHIDNIIEMNILSIITQKTNAFNQVYNVACGKKTTLIDLFTLIRSLLGKFDKNIFKIEPTFGPPREGDVSHSHASIAKSKKLLDYKAKKDLISGLKETVDWFWKNR